MTIVLPNFDFHWVDWENTLNHDVFGIHLHEISSWTFDFGTTISFMLVTLQEGFFIFTNLKIAHIWVNSARLVLSEKNRYIT